MSNIVEISLENPKQQIRINGDDNRVIELNLTDSAIIVRLNKGINDIQQLIQRREGIRDSLTAVNVDDEKGLEQFTELAKVFAETEDEMREIINEIFDYDVCTPMVGKNSVFSTKNGEFLYETIINKLMDLYGDAIGEETKKVRERMSKHTSKYIK